MGFNLSWDTALPLPQDIFGYTTNADNTLSITNCTWTGDTIAIPREINGVRVTIVADGAFAHDTNVTSVTISNGVTGIGALAFYDCTGLASVTIPSSVTNIGSFAFYGCFNLSAITIPGGVADHWRCYVL